MTFPEKWHFFLIAIIQILPLMIWAKALFKYKSFINLEYWLIEIQSITNYDSLSLLNPKELLFEILLN